MWLSRHRRFLKAPFSKCFSSKLKCKSAILNSSVFWGISMNGRPTCRNVAVFFFYLCGKVWTGSNKYTCNIKMHSIRNENHFVNFTGATFALATHVYTSMHKSRLHQQVCRGTWKSILSQIFFNEKNPLITNVKRENNICLCTHFDNRITPRLS